MTPEEIRSIRDRLGLSQEGFARELGVAYATVNRWEKGHKKPSALALKALERMARKAARMQEA